MTRLPALTCFLALLAGATRAHAETPTERAESLYVNGKKLASEGKYAEACPMFEESQSLEPAIGTEFNLADCDEHLGKLATALSLFRDVAKLARATGKEERRKAATERAAQLEARVLRVKVKAADAPALALRLDGREVDAREARGSGAPVDPGEHTVEVRAEGYRPWTVKVTIAASSAEVVVPPMMRDERVVERRVEVRTSPLRTAGLTVGGIGLGGLVAGGIFGLVAIQKKNDAGCAGVDCRAAGDPDGLRGAQTAANLSTGFVLGGAVLTAAGGAMLFLAPRASAKVGVGPGGLAGTF